MKRVFIAGLALAAVAAGQDVTTAEREKAQRYLVETRKGVEDAVRGLTEAQMRFKAGPDRWSVAEVLEHITVTEQMVQGILGQMAQAPAPEAGFDAKKVDAAVLKQTPDRSTKFQAPEVLRPTARWSPQEALEQFLTARAQTVAKLQSMSGLRAHVIPHPVFGPLDGYEWVLLVAAHSARHTQQMLEVKADRNFPAATAGVY
jgi:DinB family protein